MCDWQNYAIFKKYRDEMLVNMSRDIQPKRIINFQIQRETEQNVTPFSLI